MSEVLPPLLFFLSLLLLRHQVVRDVGLGYGHSLSLGLYLGWAADAAMVMGAEALAQLLWEATARVQRRWSWTAVVAAIWLGTFANTIYFRFFQSPLEWWVVRLQARDLGELGGSWLRLVTVPVILSIACIAGAIAVRWRAKPGTARAARQRARAAASAAGVLLAAISLYQARHWLKLVPNDERGTVLNDSIVTMWIDEWTQARAKAGEQEFRASISDPAGAGTDALVAFRDRGRAPTLTDPKWPLWWPLAADPAKTLDARMRLGLEVDRKPNVLVIFCETFRDFELADPGIGPLLMPKLRARLDRQAIVFPQAYASSLTAGESVRGYFTTLCSFLNVDGPAAYIQYPSLRARCLAEVERDAGYSTMAFSAFGARSQNMANFEELHGTQVHHDGPWFTAQGVTERIGALHLIADRPMLKTALGALVSAKEPFFATIATSTSHWPWDVIPEGPVPDALAKGDPAYVGYLSRLAYLDRALDEFLDGLFASPIGADTVVVLLGDHGTAQVPALELDPPRDSEVKFRIPIAILTRDLPRPERLPKPVHQLDIAPTIATITGATGSVGWLGRDMLDGAGGSDWVFLQASAISYRTRDLGCYGDPITGKTRCWKIPPGADPLFDTGLTEVPQDPADEKFFRDVVRGSTAAIELNRIAPPR